MKPLWKTVWSFLRKQNIESPYDPAIPLLGIYPDKTILQKDTCAPMFTAALFTIAKTWKQPKCPWTEEEIKKMSSIYTMEYYPIIQMNDGSSHSGPVVMNLAGIHVDAGLNPSLLP